MRIRAGGRMFQFHERRWPSSSGPAAVRLCPANCRVPAICLPLATFLSLAMCGAVAEEVPPSTAPDMRVRVALDVAGHLLAPGTGAGGPDTGGMVREPVTVSARFDFEESPVAAAVVRRQFCDASAGLQIGERHIRTSLEPDARLVLVARRGTTPVPYLADGFLSGEEVDLLETPFDSLLLDDLLPAEAVSIGGVWQVSPDLVAGLLAIDTVESGGIEARLVGVEAGRAKVAMTGVIDGAVDGVPTHVTVEGTFAAGAQRADAPNDADDAEPVDETVDETVVESVDEGDSAAVLHRLVGRVLSVSAVIAERRQPGHVAPGFDVEARLQVARGPVEASPDVRTVVEPAADRQPPAVREATVTRRRGPGGPGQVWYRDPQDRFDLVHDARWRRIEDGPSGLVLRFVDHGTLVGQCSVTSMTTSPMEAAGTRVPGIEDVRKDIERSLAGQIGRIDAEEQGRRPDGLHVVRVEASGAAGRLPFRWIHYVIATDDGRRAGVTFMFEESLRERFANADRTLVESFRFATPRAVPPEGPTAAVPDAGGPVVR